VIRIDHFGNVVTDLEADSTGTFRSITVGSNVVKEQASTYAERFGSDDPFVIVGSMGTLEVSVANGNAAAKLNVKVRDRVSVTR